MSLAERPAGPRVTELVSGVRERLGAAIFHRVAGPQGPAQRDRIHGTPGPRWFAPDSPIGRVHGDASMFVGGMRALMLQSLHPKAMTAVAEHSGYRGDMWGRLARTSTYLAVTTFGTAEHAEASIATIRRIHDRITGTMPDGTPYAASDPHLLAWVHVAEIDSFLRAHQLYGAAPLDQAGRDEYVAQTAKVARRLGVLDPPHTEAALAATLESYRPELAGSEHARDAIDFLLRDPPLPRAARPAYAALALAAVATMPQWTREPLGLPDRPAVDRTAGRASGAVMTRAIRWAMTPGRASAQEKAALRDSA
ncbi:oxygenase MpaB family protein [Nocardioides donggukensis]|uniref:DUF2236 domain-containing protein n=1 Tax=Nocardioides donggukensis TaxID=2774019 RepID=A0A927K204_9ACTN|nr:oxygenase MpaB family protein [Nocardioides donggukensis]MBD8868459.1 DUF2236 domain-containing protein [Nocardioides donggukensis]